MPAGERQRVLRPGTVGGFRAASHSQRRKARHGGPSLRAPRHAVLRPLRRAPAPAVFVRRSTQAAAGEVLSASDQRADTLPAGCRTKALRAVARVNTTRAPSNGNHPLVEVGVVYGAPAIAERGGGVWGSGGSCPECWQRGFGLAGKDPSGTYRQGGSHSRSLTSGGVRLVRRIPRWRGGSPA
jgi:hypothetical protein